MLISGKLLSQLKDDLPSYYSDEFEADMAFAAWMRVRVRKEWSSLLMHYSCTICD